MKIKNICLLILMGSISLNAYAEIERVRCVGMDRNNNYKTWNILLDFKSDQFIANGDVFNISNYITRGEGVTFYTVNFWDVNHWWIYDALIMKKENNVPKFYFAQFDGYSHQLISSIKLSCHIDNT